MLKMLAHDVINDIAIIQTSFAINVRYGLEVTPCQSLAAALIKFRACQHHAMSCEGLFDDAVCEYEEA